MTIEQKKGIIFALLVGTSWGLSSVFVQYLLNVKHLEIPWMITTKMICGGLIMLLYCKIRGYHSFYALLHSKKSMIVFLCYMLLGLVGVQVSYITSIRYSNAGTAIALNYTCMIFILFIGCIQEKRKPLWAEILALLLAIAGVFFIATHGQIGNLAISPKGLLWGLISAIAQTLYTILPRSLVKQYRSEEIVTAGMLLGGIIVGIFSQSFYPLEQIDTGIVMGLVGIVVLGTIIPFLLFLKSIELIGTVQTGLFVAVETVVTPLMALVILKTAYQKEDFYGFVCMVLMVLVLTYGDLKREKING